MYFLFCYLRLIFLCLTVLLSIHQFYVEICVCLVKFGPILAQPLSIYSTTHHVGLSVCYCSLSPCTLFSKFFFVKVFYLTIRMEFENWIHHEILIKWFQNQKKMMYSYMVKRPLDYQPFDCTTLVWKS